MWFLKHFTRTPESLHEKIKESQNFTDGQWSDMIKQMTGRPNDEDAANDKVFAKEVFA